MPQSHVDPKVEAADNSMTSDLEEKIQCAINNFVLCKLPGGLQQEFQTFIQGPLIDAIAIPVNMVAGQLNDALSPLRDRLNVTPTSENLTTIVHSVENLQAQLKWIQKRQFDVSMFDQKLLQLSKLVANNSSRIVSVSEHLDLSHKENCEANQMMNMFLTNDLLHDSYASSISGEHKNDIVEMSPSPSCDDNEYWQLLNSSLPPAASAWHTWCNSLDCELAPSIPEEEQSQSDLDNSWHSWHYDSDCESVPSMHVEHPLHVSAPQPLSKVAQMIFDFENFTKQMSPTNCPDRPSACSDITTHLSP